MSFSRRHKPLKAQVSSDDLDVSSLPFADENHTHTDADITDVAWSKLTGVPSTFAPSSHTHTSEDLPDFEPPLGDPDGDGQVLHSDADGTRYWQEVEASGGITPGSIRPTDLAAVNAPTVGAIPMYYSDDLFIWVDGDTLVPSGGLNMQTDGSLNMVS